MKIRSKLGLGFGIQVLFSVGLSICVLISMHAMKKQFSLVVEHHSPVLINAQLLEKLVINMETGQRGFCITYQEEFLEPYTLGERKFDILIKKERELVSDDLDQVAALERIESLVQQWKDQAAEPEIAMARKAAVHERDAQDFQALLDALGRGEGKEFMDQIIAGGYEIEIAFTDRGDWESAFVIELIEKSVTSLEDGLRGFLIFGDEDLLENDYFEEKRKLPERFARLRTLVSQRGRGDELSGKVDQLEQQIQEWIENAAEVEIAARRKLNEHPESPRDVAALFEVGTGKSLLDAIRREFARFIETETKLAENRYNIALGATARARNMVAGLLLVAIGLGIFIAVMLSRAIVRPLDELATGAEAVGAGDLRTQIKIRSLDEIGILARAFNAMVTRLKKLDQQQEKSRERLAKEVTRKDAQARLSDSMREAEDLATLGNRVIASLVESTQSQVGMLYTRTDPTSDELSLTGTYAVNRSEPLVSMSSTSGNLVGQAAFEKKSLLLTQIPEDYIKISSSLGEVVPRSLLIVPILLNGEAKGVVELGSLYSFGDGQKADVETLVEPVAAAIHVMQGQERISALLGESQVQADQLWTANKSLEENSEALRLQSKGIESRNKQLQEAHRKLEEKAQELATTNKFKSEFLANMSHEIRTPMTAILGFAEIVLGNVNDPQNIEGLKTIQRNGKYLLGIINDILDLSKIEAGKMVVEKITCSPCQVISEVASLMRVPASAKDLPLQIDFAGPVPQSIKSDPARLRQILINLIGNAIKFTEVGKIHVVVRLLHADAKEPALQVDVIDTGIGMTHEQTDNLFQPFVQADTSTTRKFGGTGLGLVISRRLAEMLGGNIGVSSIFGKGSTLTLTLQTGSLEGVKMVESPTEVESSTKKTSKLASKKISLDCRVLLAEDGPDNRKLISFILKKAGAEVTTAKNGQVALDLALEARDKGSPFHVILMDMQMPVLDGYDATGKLREAGYNDPILALTAHAMKSDREKCISAGCDDFMTKPIDRERLISLVAQYATRQELPDTGEILAF